MVFVFTAAAAAASAAGQKKTSKINTACRCLSIKNADVEELQNCGSHRGIVHEKTAPDRLVLRFA